MENTHKTTIGHTIGAIALVAGTCVGGGMLALPVDTGAIGFYPSLLSLFIAWIFMTITGLFLVESSLWLERDAHFMTLSSRLLGKVGKYICVFFFLFMGYGSLIAYASGGSILLVSFCDSVFGLTVSRVEACAIFSAILGLVIYFGTQLIGKINTILVVGMIISYFAIVGGGLAEVKGVMLTRANYTGMALVFPLMLATFSYQMIVPSLTFYLNRDPRALKKAIVIGTSLPFIAYAIWELIVLGTVPYEGAMGLKHAFTQGFSATEPLKHYVSMGWLSVVAEMFAFFAIVTSFLGIGLGLFDFLSDLTKIKKKGWGKLALILLAIIPTIFFAILFPNAFMTALEISGGFGDAILSIILPVLFIWIGRYYKRYESVYIVGGGRFALSVTALFAVFVLSIQIYKLI
ncbi:MAG: aromatic amino acid transport family protein [Rhabdochlamydiaceae bacterium]|nr:aromatic amino acid transport family protein [Candidatus Amphrikana amoebophyrae]